jgi:pimeloyl-ACP methyl ester carboxylesterase
MYAFRPPTSDAALCYHDLPGDDPAIVVLPGMFDTSASWVEVVREPLLVRRRCVLVDLLGLGYSNAPADFSYTVEDHAATVAALLDHLGVRGCALVGHSFGGSVAITLASQRPDLVGALVAAEANLDPGVGGVSKEVVAQSEAEYVQTGHALLCQGLKERLGALPAYGGLFSSACRASALAAHRGCVSLLADRRPTLRERLVSLSQPRGFLFGARNLAIPADAELRDWLAARGISVHAVPDAGHVMNMDNPAGTAQAIAEALGIGAPASAAGAA